MEKMENYKRFSISELKFGDEDLQMLMTMGLVIGGTWLDLLSLKSYIGKLPGFKMVYNTISTSRLRVVKVGEFEDYLEWRAKNQVDWEAFEKWREEKL
jgi:hypothetical protein